MLMAALTMPPHAAPDEAETDEEPETEEEDIDQWLGADEVRRGRLERPRDRDGARGCDGAVLASPRLGGVYSPTRAWPPGTRRARGHRAHDRRTASRRRQRTPLGELLRRPKRRDDSLAAVWGGGWTC